MPASEEPEAEGAARKRPRLCNWKRKARRDDVLLCNWIDALAALAGKPWKTHLVQACRSLLVLKNAAEDGTVSDKINRVIGHLNFLMRHATDFDIEHQLPHFWLALTEEVKRDALWKARNQILRLTAQPPKVRIPRSTTT